MKAYQFEDAERGLKLIDVPVPVPASDQVLIKVEAAGLCHSDVHIISGVFSDHLKKRPMTLGHEVAGVVVEVGSGVSNFVFGDRVVIASVLYPIEERSSLRNIGLDYDGGYAPFAVADACRVVKIPDGVSCPQAAVATDAVATAYHAIVIEAEAAASKTIGIIGLGGLGLNGVQIASLQGSKVYGIDIDAKKFAEAQRYGAITCFSSLKEASGIMFDSIVDFASIGSTLRDAVNAVKLGGTVVSVGLGGRELSFDTASLVLKNVHIKGSLAASLEDFTTVLQLISEGYIKPRVEEIGFDSVVEGLARLHRGQVVGRLFTNPSKG
ncbi:hypothetical protein OIDMADRAFT_124498 [Oidiodendron maius Zn]|uniref:Enoyl reductase (ER) domain-containing protein n=1 Tax=Oidiodendron maius (strain Zn) TaxID=913774 RepID=A0A0C3CP20_OIDMZ|nr:hypothetical protein OIDMADRAFT_124498 [Oidiodendron maius Zn]